MIPNIVRGSDPAGLVRYLFGKGRRNEHTDQHLVCASGDMFPSFDMDGKPAASYAEIGRRFDRRYRVRERKDDPFPPDMRGKNNPEREHGRKRVWHCSLAIKAGQGILTDQEWEAVIRDYLTRMNIIDGDDDQGVTWLAVRHGLSANGNDHVHIMVQLAADDGWINPFHDRINAQKSCRRMEKTRPELVELARSDTGTRVSWQYGQWRQWAEWKARNEYGDD
ncbi:MAG: relaxase/mobilization nuclease domain-containing protein, partial [Bifidobacterium longum]